MPYRYPDSYRYARRDFDAVAARYLDGHSLEESAGPVNISTAARFLRLNGLTRPAPITKRLTRERRAAHAAALQRRGLSVATIARRLDLSMRQTARYLATARAGEPLP